MKSEKTFQKFLLLVLILLLAMGISACHSEDPPASETDSQQAEEPADPQELYHLRATAASLASSKLLEKIGTSSKDYAGMYADELGCVVFCVTEEAAIARCEEILTPDVLMSCVQEAREMLELNEDDTTDVAADELVRYEVKKYSFAMLEGARDLLEPVMEKYEISLLSLDQSENVLKISTLNDEQRPEILAYLQENGYFESMVCFEHSNG